MNGEAFLIGMLFVVYLLARLLGWVAERAGAPSFVGEIVAGILLINVTVGPYNLAEYLGIDPFSSGEAGGLNASALLIFFYAGLVFLVFTVGLHVRPGALRSVARESLGIAAVGVVVPFALGAAVVLGALGESSLYAVLLIGTALAASSLGIVSRLLYDDGLLDQREGTLLLGAAVFEDLIAFVLLAILLAFAAHGSSLSLGLVQQVVVVVVLAVGFVIAFLLFAEPAADRLAPRVILQSARSRGDRRWQDGILAASLLVCLGVAFVATTFQLAAVLGAFFAGMALSPLVARSDLDRAFEALNALFVPFFFVYIGLFLDGDILAPVVALTALITAIAIVGKLAAGTAHVRSLGREGALTVGTALMARGEVAIILAIAALETGLLADQYLAAIVVMSIVTTIVGPWMFRWVRRRASTAPQGSPSPTDPP
ncbi:MAG: cation:proton antiporter [Thermoplasmata archaeon]